MRKYKVIWFDDEHDKFQPYKDEAILNNVSLVLVKEGKISRLFNNIKTLLKLNKNLENDENL